MSSEIYFSVIIPLYNKEKFIERTINSILHQKYKYYEVIVVDDGSTDGGVDKVLSFNDDRIRVITQKNSGVSVARNTGIENASYIYLAFLDADDEWDNSFLFKISQLICVHPTCGLYGTGFKVSNIKGTDFTEKNKEQKIDAVDYLIKNKVMPFCASSVVIDKSRLINNQLFPANVSSGEDTLAWLSLINQGFDLCFSNEKLCTYHRDDEFSLTAQGRAKPIHPILNSLHLFDRIPADKLKLVVKLLEDDFIKSQILFGKRSYVISYILKNYKPYHFKYLMFLLFPKFIFKLRKLNFNLIKRNN